MYALAASAAGVGALALTQPAEARIVYTPAHHVIEGGTIYNLDLDHDPKVDFTIKNRIVPWSDHTNFYLSLKPLHGNGNVGYSKFGYFLASALQAGRTVGPGRDFKDQSAKMAQFVGGSFGPWVDVTDRYLGLRFQINGKIHYGWARLNVSVVPWVKITATLTGYAYETIPDKPIITGKTKGPDVITVQPSSLGHLAAGASGIPALGSRK